MDSKLVVVLCLCVCLADHALGFPQGDLAASEDQREQQRLAIDLAKVPAQPASTELMRSSSSSAEEKAEPSDFVKLPLKEDSKVKLEEKKLPEDDKYKLTIPEDHQGAAESVDNIRAKKSASMQDMPRNHAPHTTTVCIQVRSEHQPHVVCGDPLSEAQKGADKEPTPKARFAFASPNDFYPHTFDQPRYLPSPIQPNYIRASPQSMKANQPNQMIQPNLGPNINKISSIKPSMMSNQPSAARGPLPTSMFPLRRSEEDQVAPKIGETILPQAAGSASSQISPQGIGSGQLPSVLVHKQFYQPPPYPPGFYHGPPSPLRLNCATDSFVPYMRNGPMPDGYVPYLRSGPSDNILPIDGFNGEVPRMVEVPQVIDEQQTYMMNPQARQAMQDNFVGSPYASPDGLSGTLFIDEDGQTYLMSDSQARSAGDDQRMWEQNQYLGAEPKGDKVDTLKQQEDLKRATEKLKDLEKQLEVLKKKTTEIEPDKKDAKKELITEVIKETDTQPPIVEKKPDPSKSTKRHAFRMSGV